MKITRSGTAIALLTVALVSSNAWWAYTAMDTAITASYRDQALDEHHSALAELLAVVPVASSTTATRDSVLEAARAVAKPAVEFDKDGFTWVGHLGYRFDSHGRLCEVQTVWSPF